ncbi:MAG TPA: LacI family DNA-binding transcriptional regulator [Armatimonadota bacterium]|nr:LacI family DNA-binding transcriptional regulator [Armatimonadota bacterium]
MSESKQTPKAHQKPVTIKDIAENCGVTPATVSRALNHPNRISAALTQRIFAAAAELGYDPSRYQGARRLVMSRFGKRIINRLIALIAPTRFYAQPFNTQIFQGLLDVFTPAEYSLLFIVADDFIKHPLPSSLCQGDVDGVIVQKDLLSVQEIVQRLQTELSFADRPIFTPFQPVSGCSTVLADYYQGSYAAMSHLIDYGHRTVMVFTDPRGIKFHAANDPFYHRNHGYAQAMRDRELDPEVHLVHYEVPEHIWKSMINTTIALREQAVRAFAKAHESFIADALRQHPDVTAMLAPNDFSAFILEEMLRFRGLHVPDDMSIVGYDDSDPLYDDDGNSRLTTVRVPLQDIGREVARQMLHQVESHTITPVQIMLPTSFHARQTTAPPRAL